MSLAVAEQLTREHTSSGGYHPWMEDPNTITEQNVIAGNFRKSIHTTLDIEEEEQDWEETSDPGSHYYFLVILDPSSTVLVQQKTDWSDSSTAETKKPEALTEELHRIFFAAREEVFEDGMDSVFSLRLVNFMERHSRLGIDILSDLLVLEKVNAEVAGEALRHVGYFEHAPTRLFRRRLLERCLFGSSARIRDGAILGIAAIDDPYAIPSILRAINRETIPELKRDMNAVLEQLCETKNKV